MWTTDVHDVIGGPGDVVGAAAVEAVASPGSVPMVPDASSVVEGRRVTASIPNDPPKEIGGGDPAAAPDPSSQEASIAVETRTTRAAIVRPPPHLSTGRDCRPGRREAPDNVAAGRVENA